MLGFYTGNTDIHGARKSKWTRERVARLGYLAGKGFDAERIARDPMIDTTIGNVYRQAGRVGLTLRGSGETIRLKLTDEAKFNLDMAAEKRGITRDMLIRMILDIAGSDPTLVENILDDGD